MRRVATPLILSCLFALGALPLFAGESRTHHCASSDEVHAALEVVAPGDTVMLEGGTVYEIDRSFALQADGSESNRITFTSHDSSGQGRYAVISTVGQRKEPDMVAIRLTGSFWTVSRIEISGERVPLGDGFWDTNGFRLGIFLQGRGAHHNLIEDVHIHDTHNASVAVRDGSHDNVFRRMRIHHIGEWLGEDYNAHEGEGFYIGSSKGIAEAGNNARAHDILIEDNVLGPGLLGQYVDLKYAASSVTVRNNVFYCGDRSYNEEVIKLAGFGNLIENNAFVGSSDSLTRFIHLFNKKTADPVRVDYRGQAGVPAPTGRDNTIVNNVFYVDDPSVQIVRNDLADKDRATARIENNRIEPEGKWKDE